MYYLLFTSLLHTQTSTDVTVFLRYLVVCSVDSGEFQDKNANTMMIPTLYS